MQRNQKDCFLNTLLLWRDHWRLPWWRDLPARSSLARSYSRLRCSHISHPYSLSNSFQIGYTTNCERTGPAWLYTPPPRHPASPPPKLSRPPHLTGSLPPPPPRRGEDFQSGDINPSRTCEDSCLQMMLSRLYSWKFININQDKAVFPHHAATLQTKEQKILGGLLVSNGYCCSLIV